MGKEQGQGIGVLDAMRTNMGHREGGGIAVRLRGG
jgi:hypothetical protein